MHKSIHSLWSVVNWLHFEEFWEVSVVVVKNLQLYVYLNQCTHNKRVVSHFFPSFHEWLENITIVNFLESASCQTSQKEKWIDGYVLHWSKSFSWQKSIVDVVSCYFCLHGFTFYFYNYVYRHWSTVMIFTITFNQDYNSSQPKPLEVIYNTITAMGFSEMFTF